LQARTTRGEADPFAIGLLLGLWVTTALLYPWLRRTVVWFVDAVVLHRADYHALRDELAELIAQHESPEAILNEACQRLEEALTATEVRWTILASQESRPAKSSSGPLLPLINRPKGRLSSGRLTGSVPQTSDPTL